MKTGQHSVLISIHAPNKSQENLAVGNLKCCLYIQEIVVVEASAN